MQPSTPLVRRVAMITASAVIIAACGGSDESSADTTAAPTTVPLTTAAPTTAATTAAPTTAATTAPPTTAAPSTTTPTTAPATTAPATTLPPPPTTEADTSIPGDVDAVLAQFCFDSEQVYVFNQVTSLLTDPTAAQAEASLSILGFTIDAAAASAPAGFEQEPRRAGELFDEISAAFEAYDYDVEALSESPDAAALNDVFAEFDGFMIDLARFIDEECTQASDVLDSHATKLAPIIEELRDWPLQPIANQAGDIRLFIPADWPAWIGSTEVEPTTFLEASNDIEQFENTWNAPGVLATVTYVGDGNAAPSELLETSSAGPDCTLDSTEDYVDEVYVGELYLLSNCADVDTDAAVLAVTDTAAASVEVTLEFQFPGGYERELLDQMLATFAGGA